MISRFVLWNEGEIISSSQEETPIPQALPLAKRLAVRQHLMESGTGAEVVLNLIDGRPTLCIASGVTIDEMELSVRSYNCLKAASIETLDELLSWKPAQLMELPNFSSKCLSEIIDIVHQFGYPSFGDAVVATAARPGPLLQANGVSLSVQQDHAGTGTSAEGAFSTADDQFGLPDVLSQ